MNNNDIMNELKNLFHNLEQKCKKHNLPPDLIGTLMGWSKPTFIRKKNNLQTIKLVEIEKLRKVDNILNYIIQNI